MKSQSRVMHLPRELPCLFWRSGCALLSPYCMLWESNVPCLMSSGAQSWTTGTAAAAWQRVQGRGTTAPWGPPLDNGAFL